MAAYYILGIALGMITIAGITGRLVIYLVRKNDKVQGISEKMPEIDKINERLDSLESRLSKFEQTEEAQWREIDENRASNAATGTQFKEHISRGVESNSLVLKAIIGMIGAAINGNDKDSLVSVRDMIEKETMVVAKAGHGSSPRA